MKKNVMMRVASALLVAVLLTTCSISGTFAKYVTEDAGADQARVAKWGVELQVAGTLYGEKYEDGVSSKPTASTNADDFSVAVDAHGGKIVAPGTLNDNGLAIQLNGTPEVDGLVTMTVEYENIYLNVGTYGIMVEVPAGAVTEENFEALIAAGLYTSDGAATPTYTVVATGATFGSSTKYYTLEDKVTLSEIYYPVEYKLVGATGQAAYNDGYTQALTTDTLEGAVDAMANGWTVAVAKATTAGKTTATWTKGFKANDDLANEIKLSDADLCWKWDIENDASECAIGYDTAGNCCKADTIIAHLQAGDVNVVKVNGTTATAPVAAAADQLNDYHLVTSFDVNINVAQVD